MPELDMQVSVRLEQLQFSPFQPESHWQKPQSHLPLPERIKKNDQVNPNVHFKYKSIIQSNQFQTIYIFSPNSKWIPNNVNN